MMLPPIRKALWVSQALLFVHFFSAAALPRQEKEPPRMRIALALSGGGARGAAHIGFLKVLERAGVKVDCIVGTSFGAIVGGLRASGYSAEEIETIFLDNYQDIFTNQPDRALAPLSRTRDLRYSIHLNFQGAVPAPPPGLLRGQNLLDLISRYTLEPLVAAGYDFDRLPIPFRAVATNLHTGEPYVFRQGRLSEAIRASISQPVVFSPVSKDGQLLVDGGLADNLPSDIAAQMGADSVIAVDVTSPSLKDGEVRTVFDVIGQSLGVITRQSVEPHYDYAQLVVKPDLTGFSNTDYARMREIIARGEAAAEACLGRIYELSGEADPTAVDERSPAAVSPIIDAITFEAGSGSRPTGTPVSYLLRQVETRPGDNLVPERLSRDARRLYATGMFEWVDYECRPAAENRCRLVFLMEESGQSSLGASLRYDREYGLQALTEITIHNLFGTTSYGSVSARLGETGYASASLRLTHPDLPFLFLEPQIGILKRERFESSAPGGEAAFLDKRRGAQVMLGISLQGNFEATAGLRFETERFSPKGVRHPAAADVNLSGLRLRIQRDTLDAQEFPRSGMAMDIRIDSRTRKIGADLSYNTLQGNFQRHFSPTDKTTLTLGFAAFESGGDLPSFERAYLGGYGFSDSASYRLVGFERDEIVISRMATAAMGYRRRLFTHPRSFISKGYLSAEYNLAAIGADSGATTGGIIHGAAIGLELDTKIGPVRIAAGAGQAGKLRFYLSLGPTF